MKVEKFKVIECIRQFILAEDKYLQNFPKKELEIRNKIKMNSYEMLEIAYFANGIEDILEKKKNLEWLLAKSKVIDYLLDISTDLGYLPKKQYMKLAVRLGDIEKFSIGWLESVKKIANTK